MAAETDDILPSSCSCLWFLSVFIPYLVPLDQLGLGLFKYVHIDLKASRFCGDKNVISQSCADFVAQILSK